MAEKYKIKIISYEKDSKGNLEKILSHTFYGKTLKAAIGIAKSHLITDYFFSSSFVGEMKWGEGKLVLEYKDRIIGVKQSSINKTLDEIHEQAIVVHEAQEDVGYNKVIARVSERV